MGVTGCNTTMHQEGCLVSCPPLWQTWALGVPTLIFCYLGLIYFIDAPPQASGLMDPCLLSFPGQRMSICISVSYLPLVLLPISLMHSHHNCRCSPLCVLIDHLSL